MPLLNTVQIAGRNHSTVVDVFNADSAIATLTAAAGGEIDNDADFREQTMSVVADTTDVVPVGEGEDRTVADATITTPKFDVKMWPVFRPVTKQMLRNKDPMNLAMSVVSAMAPRFPIGFDKYYLDQIVAGGSVQSVTFVVADGVASLKGVLDDFTDTSYQADGVLLTRKGEVALGWNVDADKHRMDLTQSLSMPTATTGSVLAQTGSSKDVLAIVGPWGQSVLANSAGLEIDLLTEATINGKGPGNGYVNYEGNMAAGWGNAQATNLDKSIDGAGFTILVSA